MYYCHDEKKSVILEKNCKLSKFRKLRLYLKKNMELSIFY